MNEKKTRKRGRILTDEGFKKFKDAVNKKFPFFGIQPTDKEFEEILNLIIQKKGDFSLDTFKKIWKREENADTKYIKAVAETFGLKFEDNIDYIHKDDLPNTIQQKTISSPDTADTDIENSNLRWVGRAELIFDLRQKLSGELRIISIVGITGIGKTSLATRLSVDEHISNFLTPSWVRFYDAPTKTFDVVAQQVLGEKLSAQPQLQQDRKALLEAMINELQIRPILLIIDMLEAVLISDGKGGHFWQEGESIFGDFLERIILAENMPSRVILTSQYSLPVLAQGRYDYRLWQESLKGLTEEESLRLFERWNVSIENDKTEDFLIRIIKIYEGHPLALKLIAGDIINEPYQGDIEAFWEENKPHFEAMERQARNGENVRNMYIIDDKVRSRVEDTLKRLFYSHEYAYLMLCMGAELECFAEKLAWLMVLCDAPEKEQDLAFATLKKRFLLEWEKPHRKVLYRLHNLIQNVALEYHLDNIEEG